MYLAALNERTEHKQADRDFHIERTRRFMALFANANRGKNEAPYKPEDFWRTSYDKESSGDAPQSLDEFERIVQKFGKRKKK